MDILELQKPSPCLRFSATSGCSMCPLELWMVPPQQQRAFQNRLPSWQPLFWHFEFPSHRIRLYVLLIPSLQAVTSYYHNSLLLCTCRRCGQEYPPNAEQARRSHGPETERTRRSTTTKDLGTGSSTPSRSCRTSSTQIKDQTPARILPGPHRAA